MNPPQPKSIALAIGLAGVTLLILVGLSGCEKVLSDEEAVQKRAGNWTASQVRQFIKAQGAINQDDHLATVTAAYWQGIEDQAVSNDAGKPIMIAERRNGKLLLYKPIKTYEVQPSVMVAEAEAEALIEAVEKPLKKK